MIGKRNAYLVIATLILTICLVYAGEVLIGKIGTDTVFLLPIEKPGEKKTVSVPIFQKPGEKKMSIPIFPNLRLEGTVIADEPSAYIRNLDTREARYYITGDEILNAKLIDIKRGMVTLDAEGEKYSLYLESGPYDKNPFEEVSPTFRIVREGDLLTMVDSEEGALNTLAEITPHKSRNGSFVGYKVDGIEPASLAFLAGLRNGDIINKVNNQRLATQQKAIQTFRKVRKLKEIQLGLLRESKNVNLKYRIR